MSLRDSVQYSVEKTYLNKNGTFEKTLLDVINVADIACVQEVRPGLRSHHIIFVALANLASNTAMMK